MVNQIIKPLEKANGYFIRGKFDVRTRSDSVIFTALDAFYSDIIKEGREDMQREMRSCIVKNVGSGCRVLAKSIPSLAAFLEGNFRENEDTDHGPAAMMEQRGSIKYLLCKLVAASSSRTRPLAIFLDDLQVSDESVSRDRSAQNSQSSLPIHDSFYSGPMN